MKSFSPIRSHTKGLATEKQVSDYLEKNYPEQFEVVVAGAGYKIKHRDSARNLSVKPNQISGQKWEEFLSNEVDEFLRMHTDRNK